MDGNAGEIIEPLCSGGLSRNKMIQHTECFKKVDIELLVPGRFQPRKNFDTDGLNKLAQSLKNHGMIHPISVFPISNDLGTFEIIAGERRWRAAQIAGLHSVPVIIRTSIKDEEAHAISVLENTERLDLNPIEVAQAYQNYIDCHGVTHKQLADVLSISEKNVTHHLRLLKLDESVKLLIHECKLSLGHAKVLASLSSTQQLHFANMTVKKQWSVRMLERAIKSESKSQKIPIQHYKDSDVKRMESYLTHQVCMKTQLNYQKSGKGTVSFQFHSLDELEGLLQKLGVNLDEM